MKARCPNLRSWAVGERRGLGAHAQIARSRPLPPYPQSSDAEGRRERLEVPPVRQLIAPHRWPLHGLVTICVWLPGKGVIGRGGEGCRLLLVQIPGAILKGNEPLSRSERLSAALPTSCKLL
ncbi:hypothetical protein chiPu_0018983 [Chiloscyllium punctatum]|uniref:Uncharacterized protein n=1 Tax=Chiloscyllium punctatum TaxID=137246 RepID=A0A401RQJ0_CHIPU|nr:hypothetical protein [Chiloscyllium punctatum]